MYQITEVELIYRKTPLETDVAIITSSDTAYEIFNKSWNENKIQLVEEFKILLLRQNNTVLGVSDISCGGVSSVIVDPKIVFATALKANASQIILAHNHPSGNLKASDHDLALTRKLIEGARLLEIKVLDHLILSANNYSSMLDDGLMLAMS